MITTRKNRTPDTPKTILLPGKTYRKFETILHIITYISIYVYICIFQSF